MAVEVTVTGNGRYAGAKSNISTYTVTEESTPVEASDSTGGTGQITFTVAEDTSRLGSMLLLNDEITLVDGARGMTKGAINTLTSNDRIVSLTADSRLGRLVIDTQADPVHGTFDDAITYYLSLAGITTDIAIDASLASLPVVAQGWSGDLWTKVKELCVSVGAEISLVRGDVVLRPVRGRRALEINNINESWTVANTDLAKNVNINYYDSEYVADGLVYPKGGWNEDVTVYTIDAGQTLEVNIPVNVSLLDIEQPMCVDFVAKDYTATSVYAIAGNDGKPITAAQWTGTGGDLSVAIGEDGKSIDLTVIAASGPTTEYAPYRIAVSAGPSDYYSSLRIRGEGVHFEQNTLTVPTGAGDELTSRDLGVTVDNVFVNSYSDALDIASNVTGRWSAPVRTISITKANINRPGETDENYDAVTFGEFDVYVAGAGITTFGSFDTLWSGDTFGEFDQYWYDQVQNDFDFQVFGNANGARVRWRNAMYRIRNVSITAENVTYTAEADTTFDDFDEYSNGMTFGQFDVEFDSMTFSDFALMPLINVGEEII